ncbi:MAG: ATP-binding protein, partial [Candidatus Zixiibacteriota bacterium]
NSLNDTVETLLNYTRYEEVNKTIVNYADFINSTIEQFYVDNQSRIEETTIEYISSEIPSSETISIKIDKMLFRQVFFNIFANSIEALKDEKRVITIQTRKLPRQTTLDRYPDKLMLGIDETIIETIITDNGPGIKQEHFERIFAPFFTTKVEGNGLGLAVAWKIIKAHGGEIFVENVKNGQGAIFYLLIPTEINSLNMEQIL